MRILLVFLIVFITRAATAQDTSVKCIIDEHLTVAFPGVPDSNRMNGAMLRMVRDSSAVYMVMLFDTTKFETLTKKEFDWN